MTTTESEETPDPLAKTIEANQKAEEALTKTDPDISEAQVWATIAANWATLVEPRDPRIRSMVRRQGRS